ncbi:MAG: glycosyltransferase family 39 protein, partial [Vicinamibacterales bacterium]
ISVSVQRALFVSALLLGLAIRLGILSHTADLSPKIADELQYTQLAHSLVQGAGFAWANGQPTSLRPPLYPATVAAIWSVGRAPSVQAVRAVQIFISLITALLVLDLGRRCFNARVGMFAAAVTWLYPEFIYLDFLLLTETLFTFFLVAYVLLSVMLVERPGPWLALACGVVLGLGTLTRSVLWPMPLLLCPALVLVVRGNIGKRLLIPALVLLGVVVAVAPWAVRNTRLQGVVTIVDTMGGMNLRMGNYEYTPEDRMWDAVSLNGEQSWVYALTQEQAAGLAPREITEGMKDKWAQRKAIEYIKTHPAITARRSAIKFADLWGLERSFIAGVQQGLYAPPTWFTALVFALMTISFVGVALVGFAGIWMAPPDWRRHVLLLLPVLLVTAIHTLVFGHSRYHLPLIPILAIYAAALWSRGVRVALKQRGAGRAAAIVSALLLIAIWVRQIVVVDADRVRALLSRFL